MAHKIVAISIFSTRRGMPCTHPSGTCFLSPLRSPDTFCLQSGVMWPSEAELFLVPCSAHQCYRDQVAFWEDVYGFDFSPLVWVRQLVTYMSNLLCTWPCLLLSQNSGWLLQNNTEWCHHSSSYRFDSSNIIAAGLISRPLLNSPPVRLPKQRCSANQYTITS